MKPRPQEPPLDKNAWRPGDRCCYLTPGMRMAQFRSPPFTGEVIRMRPDGYLEIRLDGFRRMRRVLPASVWKP